MPGNIIITNSNTTISNTYRSLIGLKLQVLVYSKTYHDHDTITSSIRSTLR